MLHLRYGQLIFEQTLPIKTEAWNASRELIMYCDPFVVYDTYTLESP